MSPLELATAATQAIANGRKEVILVLVNRRARGERIRLFGPLGGPLGYILNETERDGHPQVVAAFKAIEVVGYLVKAGIVTIDYPTPTPPAKEHE